MQNNMGDQHSEREMDPYIGRYEPESESASRNAATAEIYRRMYEDISMSSNQSVKHTVGLVEAQCESRSRHQSLEPSSSGYVSVLSNRQMESVQTPQIQLVVPDSGYTMSSPASLRIPPSGISAHESHDSREERHTEGSARTQLDSDAVWGAGVHPFDTTPKMASWSGHPSHKIDLGARSISLDSAICHNYNYDASTQLKVPVTDNEDEIVRPLDGPLELIAHREDTRQPERFQTGCDCFSGTETEKVKDIPQDGLDMLAMHLELDFIGGKNWRHIASKLGVRNPVIHRLQSEKSPFKEILKLPELFTYTIRIFMKDLEEFKMLQALHDLRKYLAKYDKRCVCGSN